MKREKKRIAVTLEIVVLGMRLLKILTSSYIRKRACIEARNSKKVVVLMPRPQEPGDAPINIRIMIMRSVESRINPISTGLNPAVRVVADWKIEIRMLSVSDELARRLLCSSRKNSVAPEPDRIRNAVINNTRREYRLSFDQNSCMGCLRFKFIS